MAQPKKYEAAVKAAEALTQGRLFGPKLSDAAASLARQGKKITAQEIIAEYNRMAGASGSPVLGPARTRSAAEIRAAAEADAPQQIAGLPAGRNPVSFEQRMGPEGYVAQTVSGFNPELAARIARGDMPLEELEAIYRAGPPPAPPQGGPNPLGGLVDAARQRAASRQGSIADQFDAAVGVFDTGPAAPPAFTVRTDPFYTSPPSSRPYSAVEDDVLNFRPLHGGRTALDTGPAAPPAFSVRTDPLYMTPPSMGGVFDTGPAARPFVQAETAPLFRSTPEEMPRTLEAMLARLERAMPGDDVPLNFRIGQSNRSLMANAGIPDARTSVGADAAVANIAPPDPQPFFQLRGGVLPGGDLSAAQMSRAIGRYNPTATVEDVLTETSRLGSGVDVTAPRSPRIISQIDATPPAEVINALNPLAPQRTGEFAGGGMPTAVRGEAMPPTSFIDRNRRAVAVGGLAAGVGAALGARAMYNARPPVYEEPRPEVADDMPPDALEAAASPMVMQDDEPADVGVAEPVMDGAPVMSPEEVDAEVLGWQQGGAQEDVEAALAGAAAEISDDPVIGRRRPANSALLKRQLLYLGKNAARTGDRTAPPSAASLAADYPERFAQLTPEQIAEVDAMLQQGARQATERKLAARFASMAPGPWYAQRAAGQAMAQQFMAMDPENQQAMLLEMNTAPDVDVAYNPRSGAYQYRSTRRGATPSDVRTLARVQQAEREAQDAERLSRETVAKMDADTRLSLGEIQSGTADRQIAQADRQSAERLAFDREKLAADVANAQAELAKAQAEGNARRAQEMKIRLEELRREDRRIANDERKIEYTSQEAEAQRPPTPAAAARLAGDAQAASMERDVEADARELRGRGLNRDSAYTRLRSRAIYRTLRNTEIQAALNAAGYPPL